jgi:peptidoglycan/LPS O-acetylase OafA/YrhL
MVLVGHASWFSFSELLPFFGWLGKAGVWLFFVLSAFLLTIKLKDTGFSVEFISDYAVGRFIRIIPLFYVTVFIYYLLGGAGIDTVNAVFAALTLNEGYAHLWTIPVEFKFYFILPFFVFGFGWVLNRFGLGWLCLLSAVLILAIESMWPYWRTPENSVEVVWYLPCFIFGVLSAYIFHYKRNLVSGRHAYIVLFSVIAFMFLISPWARHYFFDMPYDSWLRDKFIYIGFAWSIFVVVLIEGEHRAAWFLKSAALQKLGEYSFSIYLIHWIVMGNMKLALGDSILGFVLDIFLSVIAGIVMYYLLERPIQGLRAAKLTRKKALN